MNKNNVLKNNYEIEELVKARQSVGSKYYALYYIKNKETKKNQIAISASKKVGNAVIRNYQKRVTKEIVREILKRFEGFKLLLVIKPSTNNLSYDEKKEQINYVFNLLDKKEKKNEQK